MKSLKTLTSTVLQSPNLDVTTAYSQLDIIGKRLEGLRGKVNSVVMNTSILDYSIANLTIQEATDNIAEVITDAFDYLDDIDTEFANANDLLTRYYDATETSWNDVFSSPALFPNGDEEWEILNDGTVKVVATAVSVNGIRCPKVTISPLANPSVEGLFFSLQVNQDQSITLIANDRCVLDGETYTWDAVLMTIIDRESCAALCNDLAEAATVTGSISVATVNSILENYGASETVTRVKNALIGYDAISCATITSIIASIFKDSAVESNDDVTTYQPVNPLEYNDNVFINLVNAIVQVVSTIVQIIVTVINAIVGAVLSVVLGVMKTIVQGITEAVNTKVSAVIEDWSDTPFYRAPIASVTLSWSQFLTVFNRGQLSGRTLFDVMTSRPVVTLTPYGAPAIAVICIPSVVYDSETGLPNGIDTVECHFTLGAWATRISNFADNFWPASWAPNTKSFMIRPVNNIMRKLWSFTDTDEPSNANMYSDVKLRVEIINTIFTLFYTRVRAFLYKEYYEGTVDLSRWLPDAQNIYSNANKNAACVCIWDIMSGQYEYDSALSAMSDVERYAHALAFFQVLQFDHLNGKWPIGENQPAQIISWDRIMQSFFLNDVSRAVVRDAIIEIFHVHGTEPNVFEWMTMPSYDSCNPSVILPTTSERSLKLAAIVGSVLVAAAAVATAVVAVKVKKFRKSRATARLAKREGQFASAQANYELHPSPETAAALNKANRKLNRARSRAAKAGISTYGGKSTGLVATNTTTNNSQPCPNNQEILFAVTGKTNP